MDADVIVVGSGFGGAVTAARLAAGGLRVLILERGPWWGPGGRDREARDQRPFPRGIGGLRLLTRGVRWSRRGRRARERVLATDGLFELHAFDRLRVLTGSGVGGGSLIYTSIQEEAPPEFFSALPPEITADALAPHYAQVRGMLRPRPQPGATEKDQGFAHAVRAAGAPPVRAPDLAIAWGPDPDRPIEVENAAGVRQGTCDLRGECVLGCPQGAKTTMDLSYLPVALRHGARLEPLCEVLGVARAPGGRGGYEVRFLDHRTQQRRVARAPRVFLCAGTLNTLRLLFAARDRDRTLPGLPASLGQRFSPNGDLGVVIRDSPRVRDATRGPTIAQVTDLGAESRRYLIAAAGLPLSGLPLPRRLRERLARSLVLVCMGQDAGRAQVTYDGRGLHVRAGRDLDPSLYGAMEETAARIAGWYEARGVHSNWPAGRGAPGLLTVHPLGGAAIGRDPSEGVVDFTGQVFGHPGLYVADGSLYPAAPGVPPSLTIAALAERQAALLLAAP